MPSQPPRVFISYSHADNQSPDPQRRWLDRFIEFLQPLISQENFTLCSDQDISIGDQWHEHIQAKLNGAKAVVLLVSPAFLASGYIRNSELPVILKNAARQGVRIFPILISPSLFTNAKYKYPDPKTGPQEFTLSSIQTANPPSKTLVEMTEGEQNRVLERVAAQLAELVRPEPKPQTPPPPSLVLPSTPPGKRTWLIGAGIVTVLALVVVAAIYFISLNSKPTTPNLAGQPSAKSTATVVPAIPGPSKFPSETKVIASGDRQLEFVKKNFSKLSSAGITATLREKPLSDKGRPQDSNEIRYYHLEDKPEALRIAAAVRDAFGVDLPEVKPKPYDDDKAPRGYIEIWIARIP